MPERNFSHLEQELADAVAKVKKTNDPILRRDLLLELRRLLVEADRMLLEEDN